MGDVDRVLGGLLRMPGEAHRLDVDPAPARLLRLLVGQAPLRLAALNAPPGEDQSADLAGLVDAQSGRPGRSGEGRLDALAAGVELEPVEGADEPAITDLPAGVGTQIGAEMRAIGLGDADVAVVVAPDDDVLAHPRLLDQPGLEQIGATGDEVPALGEGRRRRRDGAVRLPGCHLLSVLTPTHGVWAARPLDTPTVGQPRPIPRPR